MTFRAPPRFAISRRAAGLVKRRTVPVWSRSRIEKGDNPGGHVTLEVHIGADRSSCVGLPRFLSPHHPHVGDGKEEKAKVFHGSVQDSETLDNILETSTQVRPRPTERASAKVAVKKGTSAEEGQACSRRSLAQRLNSAGVSSAIGSIAKGSYTARRSRMATMVICRCPCPIQFPSDPQLY